MRTIHLEGKYCPPSSHSRHGAYHPFVLYLQFAQFSYWPDISHKRLVDILTEGGLTEWVKFPDGDLRWRYRTGVKPPTHQQVDALLMKKIGLGDSPRGLTRLFLNLFRSLRFT